MILPLKQGNEYEKIRDYHFLKINLVDGISLIQSRNYTIKIEYVGNINETPLSRGVFRGSYKDNTGKTQ